MDIRLGIVHWESPIGFFSIKASDKGITNLSFSQESTNASLVNHSKRLIDQCIAELSEYFCGKRHIFTVPLDLTGTPFQLSVWDALRKIPYGEVRSYQQIATEINNAKAVRAVGGANNRNPVVIIIPCHRVIGKNGSMTGFGGGIWRKEWLLQLEHKNTKEGQDTPL